MKSQRATDSKEIAANAFAAELLMPTKMVRINVYASIVDDEDDDLIHFLAETFCVSPQA